MIRFMLFKALQKNVFFDVSPAHSTHLSCSIEKETRLGAIFGAEDGVLKGMETFTLAFTVEIVTRNETKNRENNHFILEA